MAATRFRAASSAKRREAARIGCERAAAAAGLTEPEVGEALDCLRGGAVAGEALRKRLEVLTAEFDLRYFKLDEQGGVAAEQLATRYFSKARAASALAFALTHDDSLLHESIYEAISSLQDRKELLQLVELTLG